jgi:hypothetical protein
MVKLIKGESILKRYFLLFSIIFFLFIVSGCKANSSQSEKNQTPELVEVEILVPDKISLNQETLLKARVTQGKQMVDDADDVKFEIWKANSDEKSEMLNGKNDGNGIYSVKKTFDKDGIYYVQSHVTARGMHVMPKKLLIVGNVSEEELKSIKDHDEQSQGHEHHH